MVRSRDGRDGTRKTSEPPLLQRGDSGMWVTRLQQQLRRHGYSVSCCGAFGPVTETAVRAFQHLHQLSVNGTADAPTWMRLIGN